jgi:Ca-activated chloride channel family protein
MASRIHRHFLRMSAPRCENVDVRFDDVPTRSFPEATSAVYDGDTIHLFHWFDSAPSNSVIIDLTLADGQVMSSQIPLRVVEKQDEVTDAGHDLARIAAATALRNETNAEAGQKLALTYQLMSEWTNCLVIDACEAEESAKQLPELRKVHSPMAAGWGGSSMCMVSFDCDLRTSFYSQEKAETKVKRLVCGIDQRSESARGFLIDDEFDPQNGLVISAKMLIALIQRQASLKPSIASLSLDAATRSALKELVLQGLGESLVVSAFLYYFALGVEKERFSRTKVRILRKRLREELANADLNEKETGKRIVDALSSLENFGGIIAAGFAVTRRGS